MRAGGERCGRREFERRRRLRAERDVVDRHRHRQRADDIDRDREARRDGVAADRRRHVHRLLTRRGRAAACQRRRVRRAAARSGRPSPRAALHSAGAARAVRPGLVTSVNVPASWRDRVGRRRRAEAGACEHRRDERRRRARALERDPPALGACRTPRRPDRRRSPTRRPPRETHTPWMSAMRAWARRRCTSCPPSATRPRCSRAWCSPSTARCRRPRSRAPTCSGTAGPCRRCRSRCRRSTRTRRRRRCPPSRSRRRRCCRASTPGCPSCC